jgi:hypothetical protein
MGLDLNRKDSMVMDFKSIIRGYVNPNDPGEISRQALSGLMAWFCSSGYVALRELSALVDDHLDLNGFSDFISRMQSQNVSLRYLDDKLKNGVCFFNDEMRLVYLNLFFSVMAGDKSRINILREKDNGCVALELMGCTTEGKLSIELLQRQANNFPTREFQALFKTDRYHYPYLDKTYEFVIMSNTVLLLQRFLENGHDKDELFEIFSKRNSRLLAAMGAHGSVAIPMGRFLACKAFYPYPVERWPTGVTPLDMLGIDTYELDKMINFREDLAWMVSPFAESQWFKNEVKNISARDFLEALNDVEMDSRRLFTPGVDYMLENVDDPQINRYAMYATQLIVDELEDSKVLPLAEPYVMNLLKHKQGPIDSLCQHMINYVLKDAGENISTQSMLFWIKKNGGAELFQRNAIKVMTDAPITKELEYLVSLVDKSEEAIKTVKSTTRRLFIEDELGM